MNDCGERRGQRTALHKGCVVGDRAGGFVVESRKQVVKMMMLGLVVPWSGCKNIFQWNHDE